MAPLHSKSTHRMVTNLRRCTHTEGTAAHPTAECKFGAQLRCLCLAHAVRGMRRKPPGDGWSMFGTGCDKPASGVFGVVAGGKGREAHLRVAAAVMDCCRLPGARFLSTIC